MNQVAAIWLPHVVQMSWQTTIAAAIALVVARLLPPGASRLRHAVLLIGIAKFAIPPMLPLPTGIFSAAPPAHEIEFAGRIVGAASRVPSLVTLLFALHLAGALVMLARIGVQYGRLGMLRRRATRLSDHELELLVRDELGPRVRLLVSGDCAAPCAFGFIDAVIVLPAAHFESLSRPALRDVVSHEIEHLRGHDVFLNLLQSLLGAIWWFHPAFRFLDRAARTAREERCDDGAIRSGSREHYARTLLESASIASTAPALAPQITGSRTALIGRLRRVCDEHYRPAQRLGLFGLAFVIAFALAILPGLRISRQNRFAFDAATRSAFHIHQH